MLSRLFLSGFWKRTRSGAGWLLRHAIILAPALFVVELLLQAVAPSYRNQVFDHEYTGGYPIEMNAEGYRGSAVPEAKAEGEYRILAVGDSTTFGTGVASSGTWPARLGSSASKATGGNCTAMNVGVPACRLPEIEAAFRVRWADYEPDVVVLAVSNNMPSFGWIRREEPVANPHGRYRDATSGLGGIRGLKIKANRLVHKLCLPSFLSRNSQRMLYWVGLANHQVDHVAPYGPMLAHGWLQARLDPRISRQAWMRFEEDLASLAGTIREGGTHLIVTHLPARFMLTSDVFDNEKLVPSRRLTADPTLRVEEICGRLAITYVDARVGLWEAREAQSGDPLYIPFDFTHLNPTGHGVVAHGILRRLRSDGSLGAR